MGEHGRVIAIEQYPYLVGRSRKALKKVLPAEMADGSLTLLEGNALSGMRAQLVSTKLRVMVLNAKIDL